MPSTQSVLYKTLRTCSTPDVTRSLQTLYILILSKTLPPQNFPCLYIHTILCYVDFFHPIFSLLETNDPLMTRDGQHVLPQDSAEKPDLASTVSPVHPGPTSHISDLASTVSPVHPGPTSHISDPASPVSPVHPGPTSHISDPASTVSPVHPGPTSHISDLALTVSPVHPGPMSHISDLASTVSPVHPGPTSHISDLASTVSPVHPGPMSHISDPASPVSPDNEQQPASRFTYEEGDVIAPVPTVENQEHQDTDVAISSDLPFSPNAYHGRALASATNSHSGEDALNRFAESRHFS